jgi:hypothetical protein
MINSLTEIGRYYEIEMNVKETKEIRISRQPIPIHMTIVEN